MPATERLMAAGSWSLQLIPETPKSIRDAIDFFGHVFVFDGPPRPGIGDPGLIASSRWAGIVRRKATPWEVSGANMTAWLGDEDGKGPLLESAIGATGVFNTFAAYLSNFLIQCPAIVAGAAGPIAGTSDAVYNWVTVRSALDNQCLLRTAEYRVNKNATIDTGVSSFLFKTTPTAVVMRRSSGRDMSITGINVTRLEVSTDVEGFIHREIVLPSDNVSYSGGSAPVSGYKDLRGNDVRMTKLTKSSLTPPGSAPALATALATREQVIRQEVRLATDEWDLPRDVAVGDWIWVYDEDGGLVDTTNPIHYRGEIIYPIKLRVLAITWNFERGMGVWYRSKTAVWTDLTRYVIPEAMGAAIEIGASSRQLLPQNP